MVAVIDLGERTATDPEPPRPVNRPQLIRFALVALSVFGLFAAGGSTWPLNHGPHTLWTAAFGDGDPPLLDDTTLYLTEGNSLTAYDLGTGARRWATDLHRPASALQPDTGQGVILLRADFAQSSDQNPYTGHTTIALDTATGRELWRTGGDLVQAEAGTALLADYDPNGYLTLLRMVRLRDGSPVWSTPVGSQGRATVVEAPGRPGQIITATGGGAVTIRRFTDGRVERTGRIARTASTDLTTVGGYLVTNRSDPHLLVSTVYRPDTLAALWQTDGDLEDCGPVLCVLDESGVTARDPASGAVLWQEADAVEVQPVGAGQVLINVGPRSTLGWTIGPYKLVDARTGRGRRAPIYGFLPLSSGPAGSVLLLHDTTTPIYSSSIGRLAPETGRIVEVGTVARPVHNTCVTRGEYLACEADGRLVITGLG
jgi:hypothetical protein